MVYAEFVLERWLIKEKSLELKNHLGKIMTDPITDMLNRIRNAQAVLHETVPVPFSKLIPQNVHCILTHTSSFLG